MKRNKIYIFCNKYLISGIFVFLLIFGLIYLLSQSLYTGLIFGGLGASSLVIRDVIGGRKHKSIHQTDLFKNFQKDGFIIEEFGDYIGLLKNINGRTIRIYYDWDKYASVNFDFGDIVINIFYEPLIEDYTDFEPRYILLKKLNEKYKRKIFHAGRSRIFNVDRMLIRLNYYPWLKHATVAKAIAQGLEIVESEELPPFDLGNIGSRLAEHKACGMFFPQMELVQEELKKRADPRFCDEI